MDYEEGLWVEGEEVVPVLVVKIVSINHILENGVVVGLGFLPKHFS
ncbi:hypothetical protein [Polycladidibacter stylochi]|nr:hypothetical protein [Pseudovibrio stylochi]